MQFLISVIDDGQAAAAGSAYSATDAEATAIDAFNSGLQDAGRLLFAGGLATPDQSLVIDARGDVPDVVDGPLVDGPEYVAGFWLVDLPDIETARAVATDGSRACNRRVELRPLQE